MSRKLVVYAKLGEIKSETIELIFTVTIDPHGAKVTIVVSIKVTNRYGSATSEPITVTIEVNPMDQPSIDIGWETPV